MTIKSPIDPKLFVVCDLDNAGTPAYYGYVRSDGAWYIMRENAAAGSYRFVKGASDYATNWTNRAALVYTTFDLI